LRRLLDPVAVWRSPKFRRIACIFLVTLAAVLVLGQVVLAKSRTPRVILLGSGDRISTLLIAGDARLLIATGTDGQAFLNAFAEAMPFGDRHVDVLVLAGDRSDLPVAAAALGQVNAAKTLVLGDGLSTSLDDLGLDASALIARNLRVALSKDVVVTFAHDESGWEAVIERGATRIRVISDAGQLNARHDAKANSTLVLARRPDPTELPGRFLSLVLPANAPAPAKLISERLGAIPVVAIRDGHAEALVFTRDGLKLPRSARPSSQAGNPPRSATAASNSALIAVRRSSLVSTS
jgi:hypothetical protein